MQSKILKKQALHHLDKKLSTFYEARTRRIQSTSSTYITFTYLLMIYFIIIHSPIVRCLRDLVTMLYTFCISPTCATFPAYPTILYFLIRILEVYILQPHYAILMYSESLSLWTSYILSLNLLIPLHILTSVFNYEMKRKMILNRQ